MDEKQSRGLLRQVVSRTINLSPIEREWLIEHTPVDKSDVTLMKEALISGSCDDLVRLHARGYPLEKSDANAGLMVKLLAAGKWPHPERIWPNVIDSVVQGLAWMPLFDPKHARQGLEVAHLRRIDGLEHTCRPPNGISETIASLAWEGQTPEQMFPSASDREALGWMQRHGWVDTKEIQSYLVNVIAEQKAEALMAFFGIQAQAIALDETTPAVARPRKPSRL